MYQSENLKVLSMRPTITNSVKKRKINLILVCIQYPRLQYSILSVQIEDMIYFSAHLHHLRSDRWSKGLAKLTANSQDICERLTKKCSVGCKKQLDQRAQVEYYVHAIYVTFLRCIQLKLIDSVADCPCSIHPIFCNSG